MKEEELRAALAEILDLYVTELLKQGMDERDLLHLTHIQKARKALS